MAPVSAFLISREWRDADDGIEITLWAKAESGPVRVRLTRQEAVMFVPRDVPAQSGRRASRPLTTMTGEPVDVLYFRSQRAMIEERERLRNEGLAVLESDVKPSDRFLMERFVTGGLTIEGEGRERGGIVRFDNPRIKTADFSLPLTTMALDLETDDFDGPILSFAVATRDRERVVVRGSKEAPDERALLQRLFETIQEIDPDVICGWNVTDFDMMVLETRARAIGIPFAIGRGGERARVLEGRTTIAKVPGRVVLDGIATLKSATHAFERFTLEHVSQELLGRGKKITHTGDPLAEIRRMFAHEPAKLAEYNLEDCRLVLDIFAKADLLDFAMERARLTGLPMDRQGGSVAAFDFLYLPRLHRQGVVAPDVGGDVEMIASPGGHVLDSTPGLYRDVLSFDFRSLYPSIIRTFLIDPLGGADPILPALVTTLHEARGKAANPAMSRAIKILMNSFYGVLGTPGCRFFDPRLPTAITTKGHAIIERARRFFVDQGLDVIYGDTDSLFVHGGEPSMAQELTVILADEIRKDHDRESFLELRFESHYERFLMPTNRGSAVGSKKRYAGLARRGDGKTELVIKGLEAVRRDWSPLARRVQVELLRRVFHDEPFEGWLQQIVKDLKAGELDRELVYRKRLRRDLDAYAKEGAPPHVRAARMQEDEAATEVEYVMTTRGPEPLEKRTAALDYGHYLEKQLGPACDVVLPFLQTSFEKIAGSQTSLF